jgi:beta-galactosidase/beta-glucuronidase
VQIKVEPPLFYQACDRLGLMVMQDMPSMTNEFYDRNQDPDVESINTKDAETKSGRKTRPSSIVSLQS